MSSVLSLLDPWYVTGFIEGDGCFTYNRNGFQIALIFGVKLTSADQPLLQQIQDFFGGAGAIYAVRARTPLSRSGYTKEASYYRVSRRDELRGILAHFDSYPLRGLKAHSYRIWREMVLLKEKYRIPPREDLNALASQLSAASPRNAPWLDATSFDRAR